MERAESDMVRVCTTDELAAKGQIVIRAGDRQVVVFYNNGQPAAVDDRCPHMGFPLHRGTCQNGIITCHWHHARFDAHSGGTFDFFAGDVDPYTVEIRASEVFVSTHPRPRDQKAYLHRKLQEGLERDSRLTIAKALLDLRDAKFPTSDIVCAAAEFIFSNRDGFGAGLTILTAMANLSPHLDPETAYLAIFHGLARTADDGVGQSPHRKRYALETDRIDLASLEKLLRYWTLAHHRDGVERTLLTAIHAKLSHEQLAGLLYSAATLRNYTDGGHVLDFCNKAMELLDLIGWDHAADAFASLAPTLANGRGEEEFDGWRQPIDLIGLIAGASEPLYESYNKAGGKPWSGESALAEQILGEEPAKIITAITDAACAGATPAQLTKSITYAAICRIARFAASNEQGDWVTAMHSFTHCNALHQAFKRCPGKSFAHAILPAAMSVYQNRFLNVPAAKLPGERGESLDDLPAGAQELLDLFLSSLNTQNQLVTAARIVARYLLLKHDVAALIDTLTRAVVREDANFHTFQMVEAGVQQYREWGPGKEGSMILLAVARYIAAHSPTQRADQQTAKIALRLHRGEAIFESEETATK